jgi:hypothetical protein
MTQSSLSLAIKKVRFELATKSHLENLLRITDNKLISKEYSNFLKNEIKNLDSGNIKDIDETRKLAKKIIQQAKFFRDNGKRGYLIENKIYDSNEIKRLARNILKTGKGFLREYSNRFLCDIIIKSPSKDLSINQVDYLASLKDRFDNVITPYLNKEKFDPSVYANNDSDYINAKRLLNFATNGRMNGKIEENCVSKIKKKWYKSNEGLNSLRKSLRDYISEKNLGVEEEKYEFIIEDLEEFCNKKENQVGNYVQ